MTEKYRLRAWTNLVVGVGVTFTLLGGAREVRASPPQISSISLHGFQVGTATSITIEGTDLLPDPRIVLPLPHMAQVIKDGATPSRVQIEVKLPEITPIGLYQLRVANPKGISNPVVIGVDDLMQIPFTAQITRLPVALHGNLATSATLQTSFAGKKGQCIVVDLEARRLGASIDPVIELYDSRHVQLAYSGSLGSLAGDARLEATLPSDGQYSVEVHDILYRAGTPNHFRLKIGDLHYADLVYPLGAQRGTLASLELIGRVPAAAARVNVNLQTPESEMPASLPAKLAFTGTAPRVMIGEYPEVVKVEQGNSKLQEVAVPAVINGRISKPQEEDRYRLLVKSGIKLRFDLTANRAGSPLDGVLTLLNDSGATLAMSDGRPTTVDPGFDFSVPAGINSLVVAVKDLLGRGGPKYLYRLAVTPADQPDFSLTVIEDRQTIPQQGTAIVRVRASRAGYGGPIKLSVPNLPEGVVMAGNEIPAGTTETLLSCTAPAMSKVSQLLTKIIGESTDPKLPLRRLALLPDSPLNQLQPWLRSEWALAISEPAPINIDWDTSEATLALGAMYSAKVKVSRFKDAKGPIRLSLLTSQNVPRTADNKQEDRNRALRIEGVPTIAADQVAGVATVIVPGDLPAIPYDLAIRAELLSPDGKSVVASAVTPSRRMRTSQPIALQLLGAPEVQAKSGGGPTGKLTGKIIRIGGYNKPVTVTLAGLPAGLPAPSVNVAGDRSDFELPVSFPYKSKLGPLANIKLVATSQLSPQQVLKTNEIPVAVQVVQGEPPPEPLLIFEDQGEFVANLSQGAGKATLETGDKYSGSGSVKVTPDQRYNPGLPGIGIRIRQNPGPGEYRYLRFAWKKKGGQVICLQLGHDGLLGPVDGKPAKFRYHAGPGPECYGASVAVDSKLPVDWTVVTRDLFADFGEFTLTGLALCPVDGEFALFDHIYLGRNIGELDSVKPKTQAASK